MSLLSDLAISCAPFGLFPTGSPTPEKRFVLTSWIHQSTCRRRSSEHPPERRFFSARDQHHDSVLPEPAGPSLLRDALPPSVPDRQRPKAQPQPVVRLPHAHAPSRDLRRAALAYAAATASCPRRAPWPFCPRRSCCLTASTTCSSLPSSIPRRPSASSASPAQTSARFRFSRR